MIVFLHIPKCGGTSMVEILAEIYGLYSGEPKEDGFWWAGQPKVGEMFIKANNPKVACLAGHISHSITPLLPEGSQYFTLLRHPVDRVESLYFHKKGIAEGWRDMGFDEDTTFEQWLEADPGAQNAMVAQLSGMPVNEQMEPLYPVTVKHLQQAKKNLASFAAVGILEDFPQFVRQLVEAFGWNQVPKVRHENWRQHKRLSVPEARRAIQTNNLDIELYNWIVQRIYG